MSEPQHNGASCVSHAYKEEETMSQDKFPEGWDEERVQKVLASYSEQTEEEGVAEDEPGLELGVTPELV